MELNTQFQLWGPRVPNLRPPLSADTSGTGKSHAGASLQSPAFAEGEHVTFFSCH